LDDESNLLVVPVIVLAEAKHIADRRRVPMSFSDILRAVLDSPRCTVFPLDVFTLAHLPEHFDIHDSLIVATALYCRELFNEDVAILTNDVAITQSAVVPVVW
jgi:predicted nucleic acid-binding protein